MNYRKIIPFIMILCLLLSACSGRKPSSSDCFGFTKSEYSVIKEVDTHGGFLGDGSYVLILDCSEQREAALEKIEDWVPLPLSEPLTLLMYTGEKDGTNYSYNFSEEACWPVFQNGVYRFVDRHVDATDESDDRNVLTRHSFNFSIAVYDFDTDRLYYFELDT